MTEKPRRRRRISIDSINEPSSFEETTSSINSPTNTSRVRRRRRRSNRTDESSSSPSQDFEAIVQRLSFAEIANTPAKQIAEPKTQLNPEEKTIEEKSFETLPTKDLDSFLVDERKITNPSLINTIDRIRTEFAEDKRFTSEQKYWDETHNWGSEESDDYWHFLGSYE